MDKNRRKHPRYEVSLKISCQSCEADVGYARVENLSKSGFLATGKLQVDNEALIDAQLTFTLPIGERTITVLGKVVHAHMDGENCIFGVSILSMSDDDLIQFMKYISLLEED